MLWNCARDPRSLFWTCNFVPSLLRCFLCLSAVRAEELLSFSTGRWLKQGFLTISFLHACVERKPYDGCSNKHLWVDTTFFSRLPDRRFGMTSTDGARCAIHGQLFIFVALPQVVWYMCWYIIKIFLFYVHEFFIYIYILCVVCILHTLQTYALIAMFLL